jgi:lactate dehydrogenase-like 2-hydroxyacid dehydrogenase
VDKAMSRPRVVVVDPIHSIPWSYDVEADLLEQRGVELVVPADDTESAAAIATADVIVSSGRIPITSDIIAKLTGCAGILCYSAGRDAVDEDAAAEAGIPVASLHPATDDVADHAIALMLGAVRMLVPMSEAAAAGEWAYSEHLQIFEMRRLGGAVLGIVGAGRIGKAVAHRGRAFGMRTIATYHHPPPVPDAELPHHELAELFALADVVVLAAALTPDTRQMIDADVLAAAKRGVIIVNVARGALIDEDALADALDAGVVGAAALDVRAGEPPDPANDRLSGRSNVLQTPHVGGASDGSVADLHRLAAREAIALLEAAGRLPPSDD